MMTETDPMEQLRREARRHATDLDAAVQAIDTMRDASHWDEEEDALDSLREQPLEIARVITYRVTLGTGGPAYGVDFHTDGTAAAWHQDWFTERVYADLAPSTVDTLRDAWGIDLMDDEDRDR